MLLIFCGCFLTTLAVAEPDREPRTPSFFNFQLEGGQPVILKSLEGGSAQAEVVKQFKGPNTPIKKSITNISYSELKVETNITGLGKGVLDWITDMLDNHSSQKSGSILECDFNMNGVSEMTFIGSFITEIGFPQIAAASKEVGYLNLSISPEVVRINSKPGTGKCKPGSKDQKRWLTSDYRFELANLETRYVSKIAPFSIKQKIAVDPEGRKRGRAPAELIIPVFEVTLSAREIQSWLDWHEHFVVQGKNGDDQEKTGAIILLDPRNEELMRIELGNVGISRLSLDKQQGDSLKTYTASL
jgi:hypothetical protein